MADEPKKPEDPKATEEAKKTEQDCVKLYSEITGASETSARGVFIHLETTPESQVTKPTEEKPEEKSGGAQ